MGFDALTDEKDPVVRSYLENLRGQIATIAARYGVNARDVFRADVQERMEIDDLATVAALVKRLGMFSKDSIPAKESAELRHDLDRREQRATEAFDDALKDLLVSPSRIRRLVEALLKRGMIDLAESTARPEFSKDESVWTEILVARARQAETESVPTAREFLSKAMEQVLLYVNQADWTFTEENGRTFINVYQNQLRLMSREELAAEETDLLTRDNSFTPLAVELLCCEAKRRKMPVGGRKQEELRALVKTILEKGLVVDEYFECKRLLAEILYANETFGVRNILNDCLEAIKESHDPGDNPESALRALARTAGKVDQPFFVGQLQRSALWQDTGAQLSLLYDEALGYLDAGQIQAAIGFFCEDRNVRAWNDFELERKILSALLDRNDLRRAIRTTEDLAGLTIESMKSLPAYQAFRARRGEDVLAEIDEAARWPTDVDTAFNRATVAIASMEFVRTMRKRLAERD